MSSSAPSDDPDRFDLAGFLPYLLSQAAEATSQGFHAIYADEYALTRTQWRVVANLGRFGAMTAAHIGRISHIEKTKVSRAVAALAARGLIQRAPDSGDRRAEVLRLTETGSAVFTALGRRGHDYDAQLRAALGPDRAALLETMLRELAEKRD